jgi:hypothetical protein
MNKTILFCRDIQHAEEMRRALINNNGDLFSKNPKYIMRITGDSKVLDVLVTKFAEDGYATLDKVLDDGELVNFLSAPPFGTFGRPLEVVRAFGGKENFREAMRELQEAIYQD